MGRAKHGQKKTALWDADGARNVVAEGAAAGTEVGIDVAAFIRKGKGPVVYSLADDAGGAFRIDPKTGIVTVADGSLLDYESAQNHTIKVKATIGHKAVYGNFHIGVADRAEAELISATPDGRAVDGDGPDLSGDGRYVAFRSSSPDLIPGDHDGGLSDVFLRDRQTGLIERVSMKADGSADAEAFTPAISADGRFVAYISFASGIVAGDTNDTADVFVFDRVTHTTKRVSVASDGAQANDYSGVSDFAEAPALSANGRFIAFESKASNLVAGDTNGGHDIFVHDQQTGATERVSVAHNGAQSNGWSHDPSISADGRYVTYMSFASNLVAGDDGQHGDVFLYDRIAGTTERISETRSGQGGSDNSGEAEISANGRFVVYSSYASNLVRGDTNGVADIFVFDRKTGVTERVSIESDGTQLARGSFDPEISADGRYVTFENEASDYAGPINPDRQVFVYDRCTDKLARVERGFFPNPSLSDDGQSLAYVDEGSVFLAQTRDLFI
ncbi:PD40 domain-containing protein [Microvirga subterranea]|uniref:WD40 repeat protein n=1 Tax=Microvirga subterranea TaxID=186651 RepID=A0A370HV68_9HYPH|nr:PD40 domain-containing protein [Microvirga subterranea]RDI62388.1 WD40 repeat protein [Microvirga subterranea]